MKKIFVTATCATFLVFICFILCILAIAVLCVLSVPLAWTDSRSCVSNNPQVQLLKSYTSNENIEKLNPEFYTYFGFRDWWRAPLVYPYSIHAIDGLEEGFLVDETGITNYITDPINDAENVFYGIQEFTFDEKYFLANRGNDFVLFEFGTDTFLTFETEKALIDEAQKIGFEGEFNFMSLQEYNALFLCEQ
jgi:hypothetical protein